MNEGLAPGEAVPARRRRLEPAEVLRVAQSLRAAGRLAEAEAAFRHVLAKTPDDPAALGGLGALSLLLGRPHEAEALLRRALALGADRAETCNALGAAVAALDRPAEAREHYARAVAINPAHVAARNNLGAALLAAGAGAEALAHFEAAVALDPSLAEPHNNLGNALAALGRQAEALAPYRRALALQPDFVEARYNHALALAALGRSQDAAAEFARAVELRPDHARAHTGLARALGRLGRHAEAVAHLEQALALGPASAEMHNDLGAFLAALARHEDAAAQFRAAIAINPVYAVAHNNLGNALVSLNRHQEAAACYREAFALDPAFAEAYANLGSALAELHHPDDALPCFDRALALDPDLAQTHNHRGQALVALGDLSGARAAFLRAIALQPESAEFYKGLTSCTRLDAQSPHLRAMEALAVNPAALSEADQTQLNFALAKAYEDQGRFEEAFAHWRAGNASRRRRQDYDEAATLAHMRRFEALFDPLTIPFAAPAGGGPDVPIFIVGMPRSGSTLVEQILASHPQVFGGGERMFFPEEVAKLFGREGEGVDVRERFAALPPDALAELGERYRARLQALAPAAPRITDKLPSNCQLVGLIRLALPGARIVHTRRDPVDCCLSCFAQTFSAGLAFSNDLGDLGRYYRAYAQQMDHWRRVLPEGAMLDVQYEDLVADFEPQARRLIDYCGLEWDARCLAFHETERPIITASAAQVREPLYRRSAGRAKNYGRLLQPLRDALGEAATRPV